MLVQQGISLIIVLCKGAEVVSKWTQYPRLTIRRITPGVVRNEAAPLTMTHLWVESFSIL